MATPRMDITSFVGKLLEQDDVDALREGVRVLAQAVMETEVSSQIGAAPYERSTERLAYRNGYRTRRGVADLQGAGRRGAGIPRQTHRARVSLCLAGCHLPQGPRGRAGDLGRHGGRDRRDLDRGAHGPRSPDGSFGGPPVLGGI